MTFHRWTRVESADWWVCSPPEWPSSGDPSRCGGCGLRVTFEQWARFGGEATMREPWGVELDLVANLVAARGLVAFGATI